VTLCLKILCGVTVKITARIILKNVTFVKGVPDIETPENVLTLIVLDDLMDCLFYRR